MSASRRVPGIVLGMLVAFSTMSAIAGTDSPGRGARRLPEFTHQAATDWINSKPLQLADLRDSVVLLHVWTFECWNCYRSFPWLESVVARFAPRGLVTIGVHSPEFDRERVREVVVAKAKKFGLSHPTVIDNDLSYWRALENRYWPAWYVVDQQGLIRAVIVGEIHRGDSRAAAVEKAIDALLPFQTATH
jgi:thiol-disulfide isomerase/thioredoxin